MDTWTKQDYPVLKAAVAACSDSGYSQATCDQVAKATGLPREDVVKSVARLGEKYLRIKAEHSMASADYIITGVTAEGLQMAGVWPNPDEAQERFIKVLEAIIDETPVDSPKAKRLEGVLAAVRDLTTSTSGNVFGQMIIKSLIGQ